MSDTKPQETPDPAARWSAIVAQLKRSNERIALLEEQMTELRTLVDVLFQEGK